MLKHDKFVDPRVKKDMRRNYVYYYLIIIALTKTVCSHAVCIS